MCEKCEEIDKTIRRYVMVRRSIDDQITLNRVKDLIAELQAGKADLHPKEGSATIAQLGNCTEIKPA